MKIYIIGKTKALRQEEIGELESLLPITLPSDYKTFLSVFGYGEINGALRIGVPSREHFTEGYPTYTERWDWRGNDMEKAVNGVTIVTTEGGEEFALAVDDDEYPVMLLNVYSPDPRSFASFEALLDHYSAEHGFQDNVYFDPYNNNVQVRYISLHQKVRPDCALMKQRQQQFVDAWKFDRKFGDTHPRYVLQAMGGWVQFDLVTCSTITVRYQLHGAQKAAEVINFLSGGPQSAGTPRVVQKKILQRHEQVALYQATGGHIMVFFKNNRLQLNGIDIGHDLPVHEPDLYDDVFFYLTKEGSTAIYHIATGNTGTLGRQYTALLSYSQGVAVFKHEDEFRSIDTASQQVLAAINLPPGVSRFFFQDHIVQTTFENKKREKVMCFQRHSATPLWEYNVTEEGRYRDLRKRDSPLQAGEVKKIIALHDDCLVVAITGERLLGLDIHSGHKRWRIDSVPGAIPPYLLETPALANAAYFKMDANGHLFTFYQGIYIEIDARTGEVLKTINDYDRLKTLGIQLNHGQFYKHNTMLYYFRDGSQGSLPQVVAYDLAQQAPAWTHVFQEENKSEVLMQYRLKSMIYDQGKIFVLDWNDVLTVLDAQ